MMGLDSQSAAFVRAVEEWKRAERAGNTRRAEELGARCDELWVALGGKARGGPRRALRSADYQRGWHAGYAAGRKKGRGEATVVRGEEG